MSAWIRFINKTKYNAVYIQLAENKPPVLILRETRSKYILSPAGSISVDILDTHGHLIKNILISVIPAKRQTFTIK